MTTFSKKIPNFRRKIKEPRKTELILSPIHQIKLRLEGYSIWSTSTSRTIYTDSGLEHLIASMQPKKHSEDYSKQSMDFEDGRPALEALEALDYTGESPRAPEAPDGCLQKCSMPAGLDYEELGACQTRDNGTAYGHRSF
jgi:hypothetical protein